MDGFTQPSPDQRLKVEFNQNFLMTPVVDENISDDSDEENSLQ